MIRPKNRALSLALALALVMGMLVLPPMGLTAQAALPTGTAGQPYDGIDFAALVDSGIYYGVFAHAAALSGGGGNWNTPSAYEASPTPVLWRVMGEEGSSGNLTLLSEYVVDSRPFHSSDDDNRARYSGSAIRTWLNGDFLAGFSAAETATSSMAQTTVETGMYDPSTGGEKSGDNIKIEDWTSGTWPDSVANQQVYLPSGHVKNEKAYWEAGNTLSNDIAAPRATLKNGLIGGIFYWLRSPHSAFPGNALTVNPTGGISNGTNASVTGSYGIRPVFQLDPESILFASEIGGSGSGATAADSNYVDASSGTNYKLTLLSNDVFLNSLSNDGNTLSGNGETLTVASGGSLSLAGTATSHDKLAYKIVNRSTGSIVGYGTGSNTTDLTVASTGLNAGGSYTLYVWAQKDWSINSHKGSEPMYFTLEVEGASSAAVTGYAYIALENPDTSTTLQTGSQLKANTIFLEPSNASLTYQWYADGVEISGATSQTFTVTGSQAAGTDITVKVTGTGTNSGTLTSDAVEVGKKPLIADGAGFTLSTNGTAIGDLIAVSGGTANNGNVFMDLEVILLHDGVEHRRVSMANAAFDDITIVEADLGKTIIARLVTTNDTDTGELYATNKLVIPAAAPSAPAVTATAGNGQITVNWTAPFNGGSAITGYMVQLGNETPVSKAATATSHTFTGLTNGTEYTVKVVAINAEGNSTAGTAKATPKEGSNDSGGNTSGGTTTTTPSDKITAPTTEAGWTDAAKTITDAKDGAEFTVDMADTGTVSGDFLEAIAGKDVDIIFDMGGGVSWTVNGKDIPEGVDFEALNLAVALGGEFVPTEVRNIDGSIGEVQLRLSHDGEFPFALTLTVTLDKVNAGYFANLYYYNPETGALEFQSAVKIAADGTVAFDFDHASDYLIVVAETSLAPTAWENPFSDVTEADWFYGDVQYAVENGLFAGTSDTTFSPHVPMTRGMLVTVLGRMEGVDTEEFAVPSFDDTLASEYYTPYVSWAAQSNIVAGYNEGTFGPNDNVTREQFATILWRYAKYKGVDVSISEDTNILSYSDAFDTSEYAVAAMQWACGEGIITGKPGDFLDPKGNTTRAEAAAMLHRFLDK